MKIFIGNNNVAGQITDIKKCFAELGLDCITATFGKRSIQHGRENFPKGYERM